VSAYRLLRLPSGRWAVKGPYCPDDLPRLRALPGARWNKAARAREVATDDASVVQLVAQLTELGCAIPREILDRAEAVAGQADAASDAAEARASDPRLFPYQRAGVRWLAGRKRGLLADAMGLGKTVQALLALPAEAPRVLVICPACVKGSWRDECRRWRPDLEPAVLRGRKSFRWPAPGEVVVANWDILPATAPAAPEGVYLVADEVHAAKNPRTQRTKRFTALVEAVAAADGSVWGLTGTPMLNRPGELWTVLRALGLAASAFGSWGRYKRLFHATPGRWGGLEWGTPDPQVPELLRRVMLRREREAVLADLPPKRWQQVAVNGLTAKLRRMCDDALAKWRARDTELSRSGLPAFEEMSRVRAELAAHKATVLPALLDEYEAAGEPVVVFSDHRAPVEALRDREGWAVILGGTPAEERTEIVRRFQAGELHGVAGTIKAMGVGVTLTRAATMIFVDLTWTPALIEQAEDRICRIGQERGCLYVTLVADHDLDRRMAEVLRDKKRLIAATVQATAGAADPRQADVVRHARDHAERAAREQADKPQAERDVVPCPVCRADCDVRVAGERSKRPGERYIRCDACGDFAWAEEFGTVADVQDCAYCGAPCRARTSRSRKNPGRRYIKCPRCGEFAWADEVRRPVDRARVRRQVEYLLGRCDGAVARDAVGFNKYDAAFVRQAWVGGEAGVRDEADWRRLERLLCKYRGQLEAAGLAAGEDGERRAA